MEIEQGLAAIRHQWRQAMRLNLPCVSLHGSYNPVVTCRRLIHGTEVLGVDVGPHTECAHYHSDLDIVAIKFACCDAYYPCIDCHEAIADHPPMRWGKELFGERAVFCGACGFEMTIGEYLGCESSCPNCGSGFNPGCARHHHLYFEI